MASRWRACQAMLVVAAVLAAALLPQPTYAAAKSVRFTKPWRKLNAIWTLEELYNPVLSPEWSWFSRNQDKIRVEDCPGRYTELPQLKLEGGWRSKHKRLETDITAVTQSSMSRLSHIELSCRTWSGVIAAAVYVPVTPRGKVTLNGTEEFTIPDIKKQLDQLHAEIEALGTCKLDMALYSEEVESEQQAVLYPVNALRNRAMMLADTEVILLLDVDFLVSNGLNDPKLYPKILKAVRRQEAIVLPAFEPDPKANNTLEEQQVLALKALKGGKDVAAKMYKEEVLLQFHLAACDFGHKPTDYAKWLNATEIYEIQFEMGYEPYVLTARDLSPWYDERFRGYFRNKALQLRHLWAMGSKFLVHPTAFVVHYPHPNSGAAVIMRQTGMLEKIRNTDNHAKVKIAEGAYIPPTVFNCVFSPESEEPDD